MHGPHLIGPGPTGLTLASGLAGSLSIIVFKQKGERMRILILLSCLIGMNASAQFYYNSPTENTQESANLHQQGYYKNAYSDGYTRDSVVRGRLQHCTASVVCDNGCKTVQVCD
jgi:hypothetical protein